MTIKIISETGEVKAEGVNQLFYQAEYVPGDSILIEETAEESVKGKSYAIISPDDTLPPSFGYFSTAYRLPIPFGTKRHNYSYKAFTGDKHYLHARSAKDYEINVYRNLALNPADNSENTGFFPHASANIETRGESIFAARNVIDGISAQSGHGEFPYQSWGINRREDAQLTIDFGREVIADKIAIALRNDFPHDNWWKTATIEFSDGSILKPEFVKSGDLQIFTFDKKSIHNVILKEMKKDESDPSPFPALNQLEVWGFVSPK